MNEGTLQAGLPSNYNSQLGDTCQAEQQPIPRYSTGTDSYAVNREIPVPPNGQVNKIRQINIEEVNRGFIVRVGCHTFAISTRAELTKFKKELPAYIVSDASFIEAGKKRYDMIMAEAAKV